MARLNAVQRRTQRVRRRVKFSAKGKPRLSVFRSGKHMYAQVIDDINGVTVASASTVDKDLRSGIKNGATMDAAKAVGELIAKRAKAKNIEQVVYDRGGFLYHGRVQALADAAREAGLKF
jgi:large subunit ribosomal protein L18